MDNSELGNALLTNKLAANNPPYDPGSIKADSFTSQLKSLLGNLMGGDTANLGAQVNAMTPDSVKNAGSAFLRNTPLGNPWAVNDDSDTKGVGGLPGALSGALQNPLQALNSLSGSEGRAKGMQTLTDALNAAKSGDLSGALGSGIQTLGHVAGQTPILGPGLEGVADEFEPTSPNEPISDRVTRGLGGVAGLLSSLGLSKLGAPEADTVPKLRNTPIDQPLPPSNLNTIRKFGLGKTPVPDMVPDSPAPPLSGSLVSRLFDQLSQSALPKASPMSVTDFPMGDPASLFKSVEGTGPLAPLEGTGPMSSPTRLPFNEGDFNPNYKGSPLSTSELARAWKPEYSQGDIDQMFGNTSRDASAWQQPAPDIASGETLARGKGPVPRLNFSPLLPGITQMLQKAGMGTPGWLENNLPQWNWLNQVPGMKG